MSSGTSMKQHALSPYISSVYAAWRAASDPRHVVLVLHGGDGTVSIYALSVVDAQVALADSLIHIEPIARMTVALQDHPGDGRFWILYLLPDACGLASFRWRDHVSRLSN